MLAFRLHYPVTHAQPSTNLWVLTAEVLAPHPLNPKFKTLKSQLLTLGAWQAFMTLCTWRAHWSMLAIFTILACGQKCNRNSRRVQRSEVKGSVTAQCFPIDY